MRVHMIEATPIKSVRRDWNLLLGGREKLGMEYLPFPLPAERREVVSVAQQQVGCQSVCNVSGQAM
ncbi:hypothetical protein E2C01_091823 [Portunus trituberculatus]|uniref:Uncharacterized protein n=1 Tax=Portunus trituberculatus TaxID=210409 RepID=A0A5B7JP04_PORTR|nr:hypothetical protein [Portunus trituberculatus]